MPHKIGKLIIHDPYRANQVGEILIQSGADTGQPDLFILLEVDSNTPADLNFIQIFLETAYEAYENSQLNLPDRMLEKILQALNEKLLPGAPKNFDWSKKLHAFIGLVLADEIYFSAVGKTYVYLIKNNQLKDILGKTQIPEKGFIFDSTLSGQVQPEDRLLVTSESLTNYISLEKIKKIAATLPPSSAVAHLGNILEAVPPNVSFLTFIIEFTGITQVSNEPEKSNPRKLSIPTGSHNSMQQLLKTQAETEKILTPPSLIDLLKESLKKCAFKAYEPKITADRQPSQVSPRRSLNFKMLSFKQLAAPGWLKHFNWLKTGWLFLMDKNSRQQTFKIINDWLIKILKKFNRLSKANKILVVLTVVLVLLFSQSLIWQEKRLNLLKGREIYKNLLTQIDDKQTAIEASLIYSDSLRAKQLLAEINNLLGQLPHQSKEEIKKYEELDQQYQKTFARVWKQTKVLEPVSLINFRDINLTAEISHLGFKDNYLYGFNNTDQLFAVNINDGQTLVLDKFNLKSVDAELFAKTNSLIVSTGDRQFYSVNQNELQKVEVALPGQLQSLDALAFYLDKMYLLDKTARQIYRLTANGKNFSNSRNWLKEDLPLENSQALALDGFLYLLQNDGTILKLGSGQKQALINPVIEPKFNEPTKIYTSEGGQNIFILDPRNKRLVIISKNGELRHQYYSEQFNNLKDFIIQEDQKKAYLLNGAQVFVLGLQ